MGYMKRSFKGYSNKNLIALYRDETRNRLVLDDKDMKMLKDEIELRKSSGLMRQDALKSKIRSKSFGQLSFNDLMRM